jgi:hypothetical protein
MAGLHEGYQVRVKVDFNYRHPDSKITISVFLESVSFVFQELEQKAYLIIAWTNAEKKSKTERKGY